MKERILTGWTFTRALYLVLGSFVIIQSITEKQWIGVLPGAYFAAMGLFAFGCAGGNCFGGTYKNTSQEFSKSEIEEVEFEEIKTK